MSDSGQVTRIKLQKGRNLVKRGEIWYLEICSHGTQERRSLGTGDIKEAMKLGVSDTPAVLAPRPEPKPLLTLGSAYLEYAEWYRRLKRQSGARRTLPLVESFVDFAGEDMDVSAVVRDHVQRFIDNREGRAAITVRNDFARVRAFLRWIAAKKGGVEWTVTRGVEIPKDDDTTAVAPSVETVRAALRRARSHPWVGDYATVLAETGMRPAELLGVRGNDLRGKLLDIVPWEGRQLKSKWSRRTIELNPTAEAILAARVARMFDKSKPIFATETGTVFQPNSAFHVFRKALKGDDGSVPPEINLSLYDFRHFFCSEHAAPGPQHMEIDALGAYIGHSPKSRETLLRWYTDQNALRRGAPVSLLSEPKAGKVHAMAP